MMFADHWSPEFAAHGVGAMAWETYNEGKPDEGERLIVIVPHAKRGTEWIQVYPMHAPNNWAQPGEVNGWDGNREAPTFSPSLLVESGPMRPGERNQICHSYLQVGVWRFLNDSTHAMAGQKVPMVDFPENYRV